MEQLNKGIFEQLKEERKNKAERGSTLLEWNILFTTSPHKQRNQWKISLFRTHFALFFPIWQLHAVPPDFFKEPISKRLAFSCK